VLANAQRLRRRDEFTAAVRNGRRVGRGTLVVHLAVTDTATWSASANCDVRPARAGFVIPKAVGNAVVRNRVRRRLRHLVRDRLAALPPGAVLVVRALPEAADAAYPQLGMDLDEALAAARAPRRARTSGGVR
jgi:ribonuclease P protein component